MSAKKNDMQQEKQDYFVKDFSADHYCSDKKRKGLEKKYKKITEITEKFNRQSVSYQLSKKSSVHRWLKYKEGFSEKLVKLILDETIGDCRDNDIKILDPFVGSGTTTLVCKMLGYNSIGIDILPTSEVSFHSKSTLFEYDLVELSDLQSELVNMNCPSNTVPNVNYISITESAYPLETEKELTFYTQWINESSYSENAKNLVKLSIINSLERISYTTKDGQYLRWDYRSEKVKQTNKKRKEKGKPPLQKKDKGDLPTLKQVMCEELGNIIADIQDIQKENYQEKKCECNFILNSALLELPKLESNIINGVITSPPYCNRYDYTRTYALELAYLGYNTDTIKELRQSLLSCTVENKSKMVQLENYYNTLGKKFDFENICKIIKSNEILDEIILALNTRANNNELNNKGVIKMVEGYFTELTFIFYELFRLCKSGSKVVFVNDNVRYGGEVIPVDYLCTYIAEKIGFIPEKIYTLKQQKGNSSQQMKKYGRVPLRKSITIWGKI